jgi:hypothetical protein
LWDVMPCVSCRNRHFRGTYCLHHQSGKNNKLRTTLAVSSWFFPPRWWRWYIPPKYRYLQEPHGIISQKTAYFVVTAMKTSNLNTVSCTVWKLQRSGPLCFISFWSSSLVMVYLIWCCVTYIVESCLTDSFHICHNVHPSTLSLNTPCLCSFLWNYAVLHLIYGNRYYFVSLQFSDY